MHSYQIYKIIGYVHLKKRETFLYMAWKAFHVMILAGGTYNLMRFLIPAFGSLGFLLLGLVGVYRAYLRGFHVAIDRKATRRRWYLVLRIKGTLDLSKCRSYLPTNQINR
jgi:hypothetical protein